MKKIIIQGLALLTMTVAASSTEAAQRVCGYMKKSGTYVMPHYKSNRDHTKRNNYSTKGNFNPYSFRKGSKEIKGVRK